MNPMARVALYCGLGLMGFNSAKWFNSDEPQRNFYPVYILIVILSQYMGSRAGQAEYQKKLGDKLKQ